jgi:hypothetical protein
MDLRASPATSIEEAPEHLPYALAAYHVKSCVATHIDVCLDQRRRLPIAMPDSVEVCGI